MSKIKYILLKILAAVIAFLLVLSIAAFVFLRFYVLPKYNKITENGVREEMTMGDIADFAKYFTDKQIINNLKNFDASSAKDTLNIMIELNDEVSEDSGDENVWSSSLTSYADNIPQKSATQTNNADHKVPRKSEIEEIKNNVPSSKQSTYEKIMNAADKNEISAGLAIISKIDMSKINSLRSQGKTAELKEYIKSRLSSSEISTALSLYNKYKHLL